MAKPKKPGRKRALSPEESKKASRAKPPKKEGPPLGPPREKLNELFQCLREEGFRVREGVPHAHWKTYQEVPPDGVPEGEPYVELNAIYDDAWREGRLARAISLQVGVGGVPWGQPLPNYTNRIVARAKSLGFLARTNRNHAEVWLFRTLIV